MSDLNYNESGVEAPLTTTTGEPLLQIPSRRSGAEELGISEDEYWGDSKGTQQLPSTYHDGAATEVADMRPCSLPTDLDDWYGFEAPTHPARASRPTTQKVPEP